MDRQLVLELFTQDGRLLERRRMTHFPVTVGRSYSNDVIVDDPFVSLHHCTIDVDSENKFLVRDLGSLNGTYADKTYDSITESTFSSLESVQIGTTRIRMIDPAAEVPPPLPLRRGRRPGSSLLDRPYISILCVVSAILYACVLSAYVQHYSERPIAEEVSLFLKRGIVLVTVLLLWSALWTLVSRINTHRGWFWEHLAWSALSFTVAEILFSVSEYVDFMIGATTANIFVVSTSIIVIALLLHQHLRLGSRMKERKVKIASISAAILFVGILCAVSFVARREFSAYAPIKLTLKPPMFRITGGISIDKFIERTSKLKREL